MIDCIAPSFEGFGLLLSKGKHMICFLFIALLAVVIILSSEGMI